MLSRVQIRPFLRITRRYVHSEEHALSRFMTLYHKATNEFREGNLEESVKLNEKAILLAEGDDTVLWKDVSAVRLNLSHIYKLLSQLDKALEVADEALLALDAHFSGNKAEVCHALDVVAELCCELGDYEKGSDRVTRSIEIKSRMYGPSSLPLAKSYNIRAAIHMRAGRLAQARSDFIRALAINVRAHGRSYPLPIPVSITLSNLGGLLKADNPESTVLEQIDIYRKVVESFESLKGDEGWMMGAAMTDLAEALLLKDGKSDEARDLLTRALHIFLTTRGLDHPSTERAATLLKLSSSTTTTSPVSATAPTESFVDASSSTTTTSPVSATASAESFVETLLTESATILLPQQEGRVTGDVLFLDRRGHVGQGHPHTPLF